MALTIKTLITPPILSAVFLILSMTMTNTVKSQTTSFTYNFAIDNSRFPIGLRYEGDTHFLFQSLRLTKTDDNFNALPDSFGRVIYNTPVPIWDTGKVSDFETTVKFIIKPNANDPNPPADGLAFYMAPIISTKPTILGGGNFGLFGVNGNTSNVFAVEFDIYANLWDPPYRHVGIDIESRMSAAYTQISDELVGKVVTMRVNYVGATKIISVVVTSGKQRYEVSYEYDLTNILQNNVWVGIAGATGANVAIHDVLWWSFNSTMYLTPGNGNSYM